MSASHLSYPPPSGVFLLTVVKTWRKSRPWLKPVFRAIGRTRCQTWDLIHNVDTCGDIPGVLSARDRAFGCRPEYERLQRESHVDVYRRLNSR